MIDNPIPRGRLRNGNPGGDPSKAPRCGAKTRGGSVCRQPAMKNGRCRLQHQIAAAHGLAMKFAAKSEQMLGFVTSWDTTARQQVSNIEASRLANSAARMMESFNQGLLTLDRLRNGRQQLVTVQHVNVANGGQAIVAGAVKNRDSRRRGG